MVPTRHTRVRNAADRHSITLAVSMLTAEGTRCWRGWPGCASARGASCRKDRPSASARRRPRRRDVVRQTRNAFARQPRARRFGVQPIFQQRQPWMGSELVPLAATTVQQQRLEGGQAEKHRPGTKYDAQLAGTVQCSPLATTAPPSHPSLLEIHLSPYSCIQFIPRQSTMRVRGVGAGNGRGSWFAGHMLRQPRSERLPTCGPSTTSSAFGAASARRIRSRGKADLRLKMPVLAST